MELIVHTILTYYASGCHDSTVGGNSIGYFDAFKKEKLQLCEKEDIVIFNHDVLRVKIYLKKQSLHLRKVINK